MRQPLRIRAESLKWRLLALVLACAALALLQLVSATRRDLLPPPVSLSAITDSAQAVQVLDRHGTPLNVSFENHWNVHDIAPLHEIPQFLRLAFVNAEDKRFYEHRGPDWRARFAAAWTNLVNLEGVRGASTISEQVVRIVKPRRRTIWTRWLEGFEATQLEAAFAKDEILEFYLNQVPYAANRRGVAQAASYYFARDLGTLSRKEMLALAVLVRSPSRLDLYRSTDAISGGIARLADLMLERGAISEREHEWILEDELELQRPTLAVRAPHFVRYVESRLGTSSQDRVTVVTTLDAELQHRVQQLLDRRITELAARQLEDGAVLVVDNATGEVLAWAVGGGADAGGPKTYIDTVLTPRQPGSALKPVLYTLAIEQGWTAAEIIDDAPLAADVGAGLHSYHNYSRRFYGPVSLRDALGNSLNIPALKALHFVGAEGFLETLRDLGFDGLTNHPDVYGDGIALGNGAVSLFELVQAYVALANRGEFSPLTTIPGELDAAAARRQVFSPESTSLIADILSDPDARTLEFGRDGVLSYPLQTAVKTGTSTDFRDTWAVGFNSRYTVGIWLGNLDQTPTDGLTGSTGPGLLLRSVFVELARGAEPEPLYLSPRLSKRQVCVPMPGSALECLERDEWFLPGTAPVSALAPGQAQAAAKTQALAGANRIRVRQPTPGLELAVDPRLPADAQALEFRLDGVDAADEIRWQIDGETIISIGDRYLWTLSRGGHRLGAEVFRGEELVASIDAFEFIVK